MDISDLLNKSGTSIVFDLFKKGGPSMWPLLVLSVLSLSVIFERFWFWLQILTQETEIVNRILDAASENWEIAEAIAEKARNQPIGRFLYAPLRLKKKSTSSFFHKNFRKYFCKFFILFHIFLQVLFAENAKWILVSTLVWLHHICLLLCFFSFSHESACLLL